MITGSADFAIWPSALKRRVCCCDPVIQWDLFNSLHLQVNYWDWYHTGYINFNTIYLLGLFVFDWGCAGVGALSLRWEYRSG